MQAGSEVSTWYRLAALICGSTPARSNGRGSTTACPLAALCGLMRLIAATAIEHKLAIVTSNTRHFRPVKTLKIEAFKPR